MADADNGGVVNVGEYATVLVEADGNVFEGNECGESGGVFAATTETRVTIEGGTFKGNSCGEVRVIFSTLLLMKIPHGTLLQFFSPACWRGGKVVVCSSQS